MGGRTGSTCDALRSSGVRAGPLFDPRRARPPLVRDRPLPVQLRTARTPATHIVAGTPLPGLAVVRPGGRQTSRQADRQAGRQTCRQTGRQRPSVSVYDSMS